ncbi:hypothetical protein OLMES_0456 [Oleiphilus messinensis]|uniref:Uncharacterized protein n=1 Tax=Oleiphilus messinensis TaxID=141451 RepID=A0A1Y0I2S4_9GAMM|nr:hypothetical protein OLMES_0456 [Oleiphilus messinensis]
MFYRFLSKLATQERLEAFPVPIPNSDKSGWMPVTKNYEENFKSIDTGFNGLVMYQAPRYEKFRPQPHGLCLRFE